jgi:hypothetical protein
VSPSARMPSGQRTQPDVFAGARASAVRLAPPAVEAVRRRSACVLQGEPRMNYAKRRLDGSTAHGYGAPDVVPEEVVEDHARDLWAATWAVESLSRAHLHLHDRAQR